MQRQSAVGNRQSGRRTLPRARHAPLPAADCRSPRLPLAGVRVVEFTLALAGSHAVRFWANYGAEVIKVESRTYVDFMRNEEPRVPGLDGPNVSQRWNTSNGDKLGITLNMNHPRARDLALRLVATADVVLDNLVTGVMERWGLTYEALRAAREDIIVLSMPVMGQDGPRRAYRGFGPGIQAIAGLMAITGEPDYPPATWATPYPDFSSNPYHAAVALLAALHERNRTGRGQFIDLSQYEATLNLIGPALMEWTINRHLPQPLGNRMPGMAPHGVYRCKPNPPAPFPRREGGAQTHRGSPVSRSTPPDDSSSTVAGQDSPPLRGEGSGERSDRWIAIAVQNDAEWRALQSAMGSPAWAADHRFATLLGRIEHEDELDERIEAWTREHGAEEIMALLQGRGIAAGVVQSMEDLLLRDPQMRARDALQPIEHPQAGVGQYPAPAFHLSRTPYALRRPAPMLGEHTGAVFRDLLGLSDGEFARLEGEGAFE
jgi:benzylsuccinate CoA-transferase BbsF subunit